MTVVIEEYSSLPITGGDDFADFFGREEMCYLASDAWKKIISAFWQEMRLKVSPGDTEELKRVLREKRNEIAGEFKRQEFYIVWSKSFDESGQNFDSEKFVRKLNILYDGKINRMELDTFFAWYCLTRIIDNLLAQVLENEKQAQGNVVNFFYNDGGEIHFGESTMGRSTSEPEEADEELLRNVIFSTTLFDTNRRLMDLRRVVAAAIDMGDAAMLYGAPQEMRINPGVMGEWYYIVKAIEEARVAKSNFAVTAFIEQMTGWFPLIFSSCSSSEEWEAYKRRLSKAISSEKSLWRHGKAGEIITLREMWAKCKHLSLDQTKMERVYAIAYKGLWQGLTDLKQRIEREKNAG